jgi:polyisoprenoid-binding protein YceI
MQSFSAALVLGATLAFAAGCNNNPVENKSVAVVGQPVTAAPNPAGAETYTFSQNGSQIGFVGAKITGKHDGSFGQFSGKIDLVDNDVTRSRVTVVVQAASLISDDDKLTGHLKTADFFDVERFPTVTFESTAIAAEDPASAKYRVTGNLELHGTKKSITFPATIRTEPGKVLVQSEFGINRKDFGIVYPGKPDDLIKDEVLVKLNLVAQR